MAQVRGHTDGVGNKLTIQVDFARMSVSDIKIAKNEIALRVERELDRLVEQTIQLRRRMP